jgi:hypothetical protein
VDVRDSSTESLNLILAQSDLGIEVTGETGPVQ